MNGNVGNGIGNNNIGNGQPFPQVPAPQAYIPQPPAAFPPPLWHIPQAPAAVQLPLWHIPQAPVAVQPPQVVPYPPTYATTEPVPLIVSPAKYLNKMARTKDGFNVRKQESEIINIEQRVEESSLSEIIQKILIFKITDESQASGQTVQSERKGTIRVRKDLFKSTQLN